ncbi:MAG: hypothetical protein ABIH23_16845 [bacterium]
MTEQVKREGEGDLLDQKWYCDGRNPDTALADLWLKLKGEK